MSYISANLPCSSLGLSSFTVVGSVVNGFGVLGVEEAGG